MNTEKIKEVFSDEAFVKSLMELKTVAEVQAALKEKGVELSEKEIIAINDLLLKVKKGEVTPEQLRCAESGELTDEQMETVAGGFGLSILIGIIGAGVLGLEIGCLASDDE